MRERDGVGDFIAVSDAQVARGYQPPPMSVDPSKVIFEDPREAYKVRTIVRDDASSNSLFHPPATEPEFNLVEKRKPFKELHPPSFQPPPQPRFQAFAPVRQMVNPPSSVAQHGQQWINTFGPQGPPPQFQQNRQLSNTAFGNQVPVQGPVAPPRRPETESQRQPIANNESFQRGQPPSFHPQNMPAHRSNSPPMFFNHNVPQKDWDELSQSSSRQPTFHQQVWQRPPAEFRRQVGSQKKIDPRREGPAQLVRPNPPKKPEEPVNIFIHLFLDAKNGTSKELHFNQPTQMNLPKGLGSVSNPIVIHKEIDRNSLEILRKKHQPSEPPANIVQVKAVVGSSDRRMDSTLEEAVDKELERTLPMVLEKMDSPNRSNTMDEDLRKGLEQALVDEISNTIDQVEQGGISSDDLEKIIEEGFDELEKEASSPMPTLPPLVIKTTTPMFDEESDGVFEEKPDMPMISHPPPVTSGEVTSQKTPAAEHPTLATLKTTEESEVPTTEPSTTERATTRQTARTRAPTTKTTTEPPTTEATTRRTARTRAPTTKTTTEQPPATETTTKRTRAPTTKTTTEQPTTTEATTSPTLQTRPPSTVTTTERIPSSEATNSPTAWHPAKITKTTTNPPSTPASWTEESSTGHTTAVTHPASNKLTALTKVEPATTPTTTATQAATTEEKTTATTIEELPSTLGTTPEVIILKKPTKAPSATDFNEDMQHETVESSGRVTSPPSRGFPGTVNSATTRKEPRPTEAPVQAPTVEHAQTPKELPAGATKFHEQGEGSKETSTTQPSENDTTPQESTSVPNVQEGYHGEVTEITSATTEHTVTSPTTSEIPVTHTTIGEIEEGRGEPSGHFPEYEGAEPLPAVTSEPKEHGEESGEEVAQSVVDNKSAEVERVEVTNISVTTQVVHPTTTVSTDLSTEKTTRFEDITHFDHTPALEHVTWTSMVSSGIMNSPETTSTLLPNNTPSTATTRTQNSGLLETAFADAFEGSSTRTPTDLSSIATASRIPLMTTTIPTPRPSKHNETYVPMFPKAPEIVIPDYEMFNPFGDHSTTHTTTGDDYSEEKTDFNIPSSALQSNTTRNHQTIVVSATTQPNEIKTESADFTTSSSPVITVDSTSLFTHSSNNKSLVETTISVSTEVPTSTMAPSTESTLSTTVPKEDIETTTPDVTDRETASESLEPTTKLSDREQTKMETRDMLPAVEMSTMPSLSNEVIDESPMETSTAAHDISTVTFEPADLQNSFEETIQPQTTINELDKSNEIWSATTPITVLLSVKTRRTKAWGSTKPTTWTTTTSSPSTTTVMQTKPSTVTSTASSASVATTTPQTSAATTTNVAAANIGSDWTSSVDDHFDVSSNTSAPEQVPFSTDVTFEAPEETTPTAPVSTEGTASTVTSNPIEVFDKEPIRVGSTAEAPLWTPPPTARPTRPWTPARQPLSTTGSETEPEGTGEEETTNVFTSTPPPRQQTHHREPCPTPNDVSDRNRTDVVFLIDSSSSFDYQKFDKAIELVKNTVTQFKNIGPDGVQVSLVQYNLEPYLEFSLRRHNCRKWLLDDIADTEYMRGQSMLGKAIEKVNKFAFTRARGDREDADNVIVIVTDGMSDDRVQQPVQVARQNGARVLVIATLEANPNYLMDLAGHMDNLFVLGDGDANRPLANKLARKILRGQGSSAETSAESSSPAIPTKSEETDITVPPRPVTSSSWETPGQEEGGLGEPVTNRPVETQTQNRQPTVESTPHTTGEDYEPQTNTANRQPGQEEPPPPFAGTNAFGDENKEPMVTVPIPPEVGFTGEGWPLQSTPSHRAPTPEENTTPFDNFSPFDHLTHPETNEPDLTPEQITPVTLDRKGIVALQCASDGFKIRLNLPSEYDGTVLVKGHGETSDCSQKIAHERSGGNRTFDFFVDNEKCGVSRMISASPRGHNSSVVINVMHNPEIITAEDRAYILQCFVAQPDDFELNTNLDVAPNQVMLGETISLSSVPPTCSYSIRKEGPEGTVTGRAVLGETIYHTWKCDGAQDANDVYGMKIHDCFASSDVERRYPIVDSTGCSADIGVLSDPTYDGDQLLAYAESKAFGFEEVESLKFVCKVSLCTRDGDGCEGVTPPRCGNSTDLLLSRKVRGEDIAVEEALTSALNTQVSVSSKSPSPLREGLATLVASKMAWALVAIALVAVIGTAVVARHVKTNQSMTDIESGYANSEDMSTSRSRVSTVSGANAAPRMADFMRTFERDRYV